MINMNCDPTLRVMLGGLPSVKAYSSVITRPSWGVHSPTLMDNLFSEDWNHTLTSSYLQPFYFHTFNHLFSNQL